MNNREEFKNWVKNNLKDKSGAGPAYMSSLDWLSNRFYENKRIDYKSIYQINDVKLIDDLHTEVKKLQKDKTSFIYNHDAPSYGERYFYSASLNKYKEFLISKGIDKPNIEKNNKSITPFNFQSYYKSLTESHLRFDETLVKRFVASLVTKPFVILTGLAGSGKTKIAQSFMQWICEGDSQYQIVPVGADWMNREPLLGYPNGLKTDEYVTPDNGVLELIIEASKTENSEKPYFLLLDEMNLSHVERYFADFLSIMESKDSLKLYTGTDRKSAELPIPKTLSWPKNLFIIGTVNIDETTYMFSPKVLDRANVIEFRLSEEDIAAFLSSSETVDLSQLTGEGATMGADFVKLLKDARPESDEALTNVLTDFFRELKTVGAEFGYRSAYEIQVLYAQLGKIDSGLDKDDIIDFAIMQKLLPKLHGSRSKIVKPLEALMKLCLKNKEGFGLDKLSEVEAGNIRYKVSYEKLVRMYYNAINNGFTSYAEA
ncbi:McrB family protein [Epilithonimonas sp.]|uniref:McrB family protein n=1 Tax=Epilithonimonas sp. TaxID=2894511 RepID=UPI002FDD47FE